MPTISSENTATSLDSQQAFQAQNREYGQPGEIRPMAGFVVKAPISGKSNGSLYINFTWHPVMESPQTHSGIHVDKDMIAQMGLASMHVHMDVGSWRRYKTGTGKPTWACDIVHNKMVLAFCLNDDYNKTKPEYRNHLMYTSCNVIERTCGIKIERSKLTVEKGITYVDGDGPRKTVPLNFEAIDDNHETFEAQPKAVPGRPNKKIDEIAEPPLAPAKPSKVIKKGFLHNTKGKLYPKGSEQGDVPENAGDPLGYLPKKLRASCKVVDQNDPKHAPKPPTAEQQMAMDLKKEFEEYNVKKEKYDRWSNDEMDRSGSNKYSAAADWSKFERIDEDWDGEAPEHPGEHPLGMGNGDAPDDFLNQLGDMYNRMEEAGGTSSFANLMQKAKEDPSMLNDPKAIEQELLKKEPKIKDVTEEENAKDAVKERPSAEKGFEGLKGFLNKADKKQGLFEGECNDDFQAASVFEGARPGYVFKQGDKGSGYYREAWQNGLKDSQDPTKTVPFYTTVVEDDNVQLHIDVPGLTSMADSDLHVAEKSLRLVVGAYALSASLPKSVDPEGARAKFKKKTNKIIITLPTV